MYPCSGDVDNGGGYAWVGGGGHTEISVSFAQFFNEPKTALKKTIKNHFFK